MVKNQGLTYPKRIYRVKNFKFGGGACGAIGSVLTALFS